MPPKATRSRARGSEPASDRTRRTASAMWASTISTEAGAVSSEARPSARPLFGVETARPSHLGQRSMGGVKVELEATSPERRRVQPTQDEVGVGHRPPRAPLAVANRSWGAAGRFRPDPEDAVDDLNQ